jgi:prevent-host-death family protein
MTKEPAVRGLFRFERAEKRGGQFIRSTYCVARRTGHKLTTFSLPGIIMRKINIHQAKTHLSRLVDEAANGEPFIIAKAGKALVKVVALDAPALSEATRLGFMKGEIEVPEDFDAMDHEAIEKLFVSAAS